MDNSVIVSLRDIVVEFDGQRILDGLNPVSYTHLTLPTT